MKNPRKYLLHLFFLALISSYNQGCCRGDCDDEPIDTTQVYNDTIFVNNQFLKYWFFDEGSYWVYENATDSGILIDTATVVFSDRYFSCQRGLCVENCYMKVRHTNPLFINYEGDNGDIQHFNNNLSSELNVSASEGTELTFGVLIKFPIIPKDVFGNGNLIYYDSLQTFLNCLNDSVFTQMTKICGNYPHCTAIIEYSRNIGVIAFNLPTTSHWRLKYCSLINP